MITPRIDAKYTIVREDGYVPPTVLPEGVVRVGPEALAAERLLTDELALACKEFVGVPGRRMGSNENGKVRIAAFDFDGTSLDGNSPVMLVRYLALRRMLSKSALLRIMLWGAAYKTRLPQNEAWVRGLVFSAFRGEPVSVVNQFLRGFFDEKVAKHFRTQARETMQRHLDEGHVVVCVSATFEPVLAQAMTRFPIQFGIATRMKTDARGCYLDRVDGIPTEGPEKIRALARFADALFGRGGWELGWAYGDHHSDRTLLAAAEHAYAVTPDRPLTRTANERNYEILDWSER